VLCSLELLYQLIHRKIARRASARVAKIRFCTHSRLSDSQNDSATALSQHIPVRPTEGRIWRACFKIQARPDYTERLRAALIDVVKPSREIPGVIHFDIAQDVLDPHTFIATEVFGDVAARERQEALPEVAAVFALIPDALAAPPEASQYHVASAVPAL
jgi:quinol monooxygenase YgiN